MELKPCPFCGGEAEVIPLPSYNSNKCKYFVTCLCCGVETPRTSRTGKNAIERWNRRFDDGT